MRILFVCPRYPHPPTRGDQVRAFHLLHGLARHADVHLVCPGPAPQTCDELPGIETTIVDMRATGRALANLRLPVVRTPLQVRAWASTSMQRAVAAGLRRRPDVVHLSMSRQGPYLPGPAPGLHRHIDLIDSLALNIQTRASHSGPALRPLLKAEASLMQRYEAGLVRAADSASVVSAADAGAPGLVGVDVVAMGIDTEALAFIPRNGERPPILTFFGNLGYFHNVQPAVWLAEEVMPLIRRTVPSAQLRLSGARPAPRIRRLAASAGVGVFPDVPSMREELALSTVAMLPMFSGSGVKNKVLEAFATGLPVIANGVALQGIDGAEPGVHYLRAETPPEFAAAAVRLLDDPTLRVGIGSAARALVEADFSWDRRVDQLLALYRKKPPVASGQAADGAGEALRPEHLRA